MKKAKKFQAPKVVLLILITVLICSLCSCVSHGSQEILSKEDLLANIQKEIETDKKYVYSYLDEWNFPQFSGGKLKRVENIYNDHYYKPLPSSYELANKVSEIFINKYYDSIDLGDETEVTDSVIKSYVEAIGDRFSYYRTAEEYKSYTQNQSGSYVGIGVTVRLELSENGIAVLETVKDSPAEKAGILKDDIITEVDGAKVTDIGYEGAVEKIKGKAGTTVEITVLRGEESLKFTLERKSIVNSSVNYLITDEKIGYVDIDSFKANTDELFIEAMEHMKESGVKAMVYDVRDNSGGYLQTVLNMLDYIAEDGITLASYTNEYGKSDVAGDSYSFSIPTVVICNGNSASAAELFTAGLRDIGALGYFDVTIVGERTFGKGVMQTSYTLSDKSAITLTVAYYNPPSGKNYDGIGIEPNLTVSEESLQYDSAIEAARLLISGN